MRTHTYVFRTIFNEVGCRRSMQIFSPTRFILITLIHIEIGDIRNNFKQRECQEAKFFPQGDPSLSLPSSQNCLQTSSRRTNFPTPH